MKQALINLLKVKSIITITTTLLFAFLLITKDTIPQEFVVIYTSIISFYFGVQTTKKEQQNNGQGVILSLLEVINP